MKIVHAMVPTVLGRDADFLSAAGDCCRCRALVRLFAIIDDFASWQSLYTVATRNGVSTRTVRRDLAVLHRAGFRIRKWPDSNYQTRWKVEKMSASVKAMR